jgi:ribonucleotide reductase alpha subunit
MNLSESIERYYNSLRPKYITWDFYEKYIDLEPPFGQLGLPVFLRTYSRHIASEKRREKFCETVLRNVEFSIGLDTKTSFAELQKEAEELFDFMFNLRTFPSGRSLWTAGSLQTKTDPSSTWNCTFRTVDSISAYGEIFYWLLIGAGCGFSVEKEYTSQLPSFFNHNKTIKHINQDRWTQGYDDTELSIYVSPGISSINRLTKTDLYLDDIEYLKALDLPYLKSEFTIIVGDSKEGWVNALRTYLTLLTQPECFDITFDYKYVRPPGVPLKTFGGVATGCKNFVRMIDQINFILQGIKGKVDTNQAMDLVGIVALCVVSGNIRRSALIALGEPTDDLFKNAKYDLWVDPEKEPYRPFRVMSNNSMVVDDKLTKEALYESFVKIKNNGEPALYIRGNARKFDPEITGTNPCFAAGTMVMTRNGDYPIEELVGKTVEVYDGEQWVEIDNFRVTGENQEVWKLTTEDRCTYIATPYHTFITNNGERKQLKDLVVGEELKVVFGKLGVTISGIEPCGVADKVYCCTVHTNNCFTLACGLLVGQCVEASLRNRQSCNLTTNNVVAFVKNNENNEPYLDEYEWRKSLYLSTRIGSRVTTLSQWHPEWDKVQKSQRLLGVSMTGLMDAADKLNWSEEEMEDFFTRSRLYVREVADQYHEQLGIERSARISLLKPEGSISQLPTVSSGVHRGYAPHYIRRVRFSSVDPLAKALLDVFGEDKVFPENGQGDCISTIVEKTNTKTVVKDWYWNFPLKSLIPNYIYQKFALKKIEETVLETQYVKQDKPNLYGVDQNGNSVDTWVFSFPIATAAKIRAIDESAISQLERYRLAQTSYTADGHNTSITVTVAPDEWDDVVEWVYENWDCVIGVSFLPKYDPEVETYPQMPYEPCSEEVCNELKEITPTFTENELIALISKYEDSYDSYEILDDACALGSCPLR